MPEFEHSKSQVNPDHNYTPSADAKPRTRRRSGGFKKECDNTPKGNMGEIDPAEALKAEKLSCDTKPVEAQKEKTLKRDDGKEYLSERETNPQPSEETLAAIKRVEERIAERKAERDARYEERKKARATEHSTRGESKHYTIAQKKRRSGRKNPVKKKGLIASILNIFGLGPKETPRRSERKGRGGRPQGKGGNRRRQQGGRGRSGQRRRNNENRRPRANRSE